MQRSVPRPRGKTTSLAATFGALLVLGAGFASAQDNANLPEPWKTGKFDGADSCRRCHAQPGPADKKALEFVLLVEYPIWKTQDKHSQAYAVLVGRRGQDMGKILGQDVTKAETGCLGCHGMNFPKERQGQEFSIMDGVSCGGCHGPSDGWYGPHQRPDWREKSPQEKFALGMREVRDPIQRAEMCVSCHVGNAAEGKVVTHAMYAAGHPPLPPIEVALFSKNEPQHWRDSKDVPFFKENPSDTVKKNYDLANVDYQQTKIAIVSGVVALREQMKLIAERANMKSGIEPTRLWPELTLKAEVAAGPSDPASRWPEFAMTHSACFACHHDLAMPSWRQKRGYGLKLPEGHAVLATAGRPQFQAWPMATLELAIRHTSPSEAEAKKQLDAFAGAVKNLYDATNSQPFGDPAKVREAALAISQWTDGVVKAINAANFNQDSVKKLLLHLCEMKMADQPDYEMARQIASVFKIMYEEWAAKGGADQEVTAVLEKFDETLNLKPYTNRVDRQAEIVKIIEKLAGKQQLQGVNDFLQLVNQMGDPKLLDKLLQQNEFLDTMRRGINNEEFTKALVDPAVANKLQAIEDKELKSQLERIAGYTPADFDADLAKLAARLKSK